MLGWRSPRSGGSNEANAATLELDGTGLALRGRCGHGGPVRMGSNRNHRDDVDANGLDGPQDRAETDDGDGPNGAGGLPTAKGAHRQIPAIWHQGTVGQRGAFRF